MPVSKGLKMQSKEKSKSKIDELTRFVKTNNDSFETKFVVSKLTHSMHMHSHLNHDVEACIKTILKIDDDSLLSEELVHDFFAGLKYELENAPFFSAESVPEFTFIDLFAGIGGFRLAMQNLGGRCLYSSEWDSQSQKTYIYNFGDYPFGDITKEKTKREVPDNFDVLCAGFPCQAFSIAGRRGGFDDTRGTLFFDAAEIIKHKQPKAFFLENVKGLVNHARGKTLATILNVLRNELNYYVPEPQILNAKNFGVPQNRERVFIVGFRKDLSINNFEYPKNTDNSKTFEDIKEKYPVSVKYYLSERYLQTLVNHRKRHESKGNGFGFEIIDDNSIANAVVCGGMGRERNLVYDHRLDEYTPVTNIKGEVNKKGIRRMTPREWARLQGFPDDFIIPVSDAGAYKQFGNSVAVPAIQATAGKIIERILPYVERK